MEEAIQCPICYEIGPLPPRILPYCGHHVCDRCLDCWARSTDAYETIRCPICKHKSKVKKPYKRPWCPSLNTKPKLLKAKNFPYSRTISVLKEALMGKDDAQQLWRCRVCQNTVKQPRMLPFCQHSFCATCLQAIYKIEPAKPFIGVINCPTCCRKVVIRGKAPFSPPPPPKAISKILPVDYALNTLINTVFKLS